MKHILIPFASMLLCLALGSCSVEDMIDNPSSETEKGSFIAYLSPSTKTYHNGLKTYWQENDKIALYETSDKDNNPIVYTIECIDDDGSAMFTGPKLDPSSHYTAFYPYVEGKTMHEARDFILDNQHQVGRYGHKNLANTDILVATMVSTATKVLEFSHDIALIHLRIIASRITSTDGLSIRGPWGDRVYYLQLSSMSNSSDIVDAYVAVPVSPDYFQEIYLTYYKNGEASPAKYTTPRIISISNGEMLTLDMTKDSWATASMKSLPHYSCDGVKNGHEYVNVGGMKWACTNLGARFPWEKGGYYAWGETAEKSKYDWSKEGEYKWGVNGTTKTSMTKYSVDDEIATLLPEDDAATVNWGKGWRTPTYDEYTALCNDDTFAWAWDDSNKGRKVEDINSGKAIFLPATGYREGSSLIDADEKGCYWTSGVEEYWYNIFAYCKRFDSSSYINIYGINRCIGQSVRAVLD